MTAPIAARPPRIPMDQAFYEIAAHVRDRLNSLGIHWGDQAEQAAVCTLLIQAGKCGWLLPWNSPGPIAPARESSSRSAIPINRPSEPGKIDARDAAASRRDSQHPPEFRTHQQAPSAKSESVIVRAFREIEKELDPDVYRTILAWYGAERPEDFRPQDIHGSTACYVALKRARDQYRVEQLDTLEHFEATEEGWR